MPYRLDRYKRLESRRHKQRVQAALKPQYFNDVASPGTEMSGAGPTRRGPTHTVHVVSRRDETTKQAELMGVRPCDLTCWRESYQAHLHEWDNRQTMFLPCVVRLGCPRCALVVPVLRRA